MHITHLALLLKLRRPILRRGLPSFRLEGNFSQKISMSRGPQQLRLQYAHLQAAKAANPYDTIHTFSNSTGKARTYDGDHHMPAAGGKCQGEAMPFCGRKQAGGSH